MALGDGIRRNIAHVDPSERALLRDAFLELNRIPFPGNRTETPPGGVTWWFKQDEIHHATHVHGGPEFIPWHRELVNRLEAMLREINPQLSLHYWDWTQDPRSIPNANLGGRTTGTLNLFTEAFMGYGGPTSQVIGPPWQNSVAPWRRDGYYVPGANPHRDSSENAADPPAEVTRFVSGSPVPAEQDAAILAADDYAVMRRRLEGVHDGMHGFVNMGGPHIAFRDPFVFLLHSNVDRLFARWQTDPAHPERLDPSRVYGSESGKAELNGNIRPWSGVTTRPWAPPENQQVPKTYKDPSVITPPLYDTNFATRPRAADGWVTSWGNNRLDIFAIGTDSAMYHKALDGSTWRPSPLNWDRLGGTFTGPPAVAAWRNNRLDVFGLGADGAIYHKVWDGSTWRPSPLEWERFGSTFHSPPAVTAWDNNRLDVFAVGTDAAMYHKTWDGSAWLDWQRLGGTFTSPPAVAAWGNNRLDIFAIGIDSAMYHKAWDGSAWRPSLVEWERLGGIFTSPPAVTAWGNNRLDIFAVSTDSSMYHKAWDGSAWRPSLLDWEPLGGNFHSPPAVAAWGNNRLDIFAIGIDSAMYHKAWDGSGWRPSPVNWERLGGIFISPPAVTAWGNNRLDVFGLSTDAAMYHKAWDGSAWLDWQRLGGTFIAP